MGWVPNCTRGCSHLLPVAASGFACAATLLGLHSVPCGGPWSSHSPAHPALLSPQVLQTGEMWLLLMALCLAQGLEDAIPDAGVVYNPERSMNIVSAGVAPHFPMGVLKIPPKG